MIAGKRFKISLVIKGFKLLFGFEYIIKLIPVISERPQHKHNLRDRLATAGQTYFFFTHKP
jgi:hypothetical protein